MGPMGRALRARIARRQGSARKLEQRRGHGAELMASPKRQLKISSRSLPKHLAGRLNERVEKMKEDPSVLLPRCEHTGGCPRSSLARKLERVKNLADSRSALRRQARRGTPLARAYAGALDLLFEEETPMMAGFPNPFGGGEVKFVQRGNAKKEVQAGVQNYTDKGLRLLAFIPYARGFRGVYLFSTDQGLACTARVADPPQAYLAQCAATHRPSLQGAGTEFTCPHLRGKASKVPRETAETQLAARWVGSQTTFRVCQACASGGNLSQDLRRFAVGPKVLEQVEVWVELRPACREAPADGCHFDQRLEIAEEDLDAFHRGELTDEQALGKTLKRALQEAAAGGSGFVFAGGACHGNDHAKIIDLLGPEAEMRRALAAALSGAKGDIVLDALTPSKLLSKFWGQEGRAILEQACGDGQVAARVLREAKPNEAPATLVSRAVKLAREAAIDTALPAFKGLGEEAALADGIARAFRRGGVQAALREIEEGRARSPAAGSVGWAFLQALEKGAGKEWQFTKVEIERGAHARQAVRVLLDCKAEGYAKALGEALQALGVHEPLEVKTT